MIRTHFLLLLVSVTLLAACTSAPQPLAATNPALVSSLGTEIPAPPTDIPLPTATPDNKAISESLLSILPACQGLVIEDHPIVFSWPDLASRIQELGIDTSWGYYGCDQSRTALETFYKAQLTQEPYDYMETAWVDRDEGSVGNYYVTYGSWLYLWVIPQPDDPQKSFIIIAISSQLVDC